jgi:hypothetical protein
MLNFSFALPANLTYFFVRCQIWIQGLDELVSNNTYNKPRTISPREALVNL